MERGIDFYITALEDVAGKALEAVVPATSDIAPYGGELDAGKVEQIVEKIAPRFPLYLYSYAGGHDTRESLVSPDPGAPWIVRHDFDFVVVVADADARGEDVQRLGAYSMIGIVHQALSGRQLIAVLNEGEPDEERVLLNAGELIPTDVEHVMHLPDATVYSVPFTGYFKYLSPDRRDEGQPINAIVFEIGLMRPARPGAGAPGVTATIEE